MSKDNNIKHFNIRVYALILNKQNQILICDEYRMGMEMTKFPGGGLEFGEGTLDCLQREAMEEFGQEIEIIEHFYTTDYFQQALFFEDHQLISIYYRTKFKEKIKFPVSTRAFDFDARKEGSISFRWKNIQNLSENDFSFPIDKKVAKMLKEKFS